MIFDWDDTNRDHLARHNITVAEAEQVLDSYPVELLVEQHETDGIRVRFIGETSKGRILILIVTWRGSAIRVITGWDAPNSSKRNFLQGRRNDHG